MQVLEAAVKKVGSFDNEKVRDAIAGLELHTVMGKFKPNDKGLSDHEGLTFQILKGERRIVWPEKFAETKYELPMPAWDKR
jgi:branched-chain amino acid transport system substrate-binding protein